MSTTQEQQRYRTFDDFCLSWVGHFFFEHNRPATFKYPLFSFMGDWKLWWETLTGKRAF